MKATVVSLRYLDDVIEVTVSIARPIYPKKSDFEPLWGESANTRYAKAKEKVNKDMNIFDHLHLGEIELVQEAK